MWTCPKCKKTFRNKNQWHSCAKIDVSDHFDRAVPPVKKIYDRLMAAIGSFGTFTVNSVKSSIQIKILSTFLGIKVKEDHLIVEFYLDREYHQPPVFKIFKMSKHRIVHAIRLHDPKQIDKKLVKLLKESHTLVNS